MTRQQRKSSVARTVIDLPACARKGCYAERGHDDGMHLVTETNRPNPTARSIRRMTPAKYHKAVAAGRITKSAE